MPKSLVRHAVCLACALVVLPNHAADAPLAAPSAAAGEIAEHVLRHDQPHREASSDIALSSRVSGLIRDDPGMAGSDISVNADRGVVILTGTVRTQEQAAVASAYAQRFDGVRRVDSHLSTIPQ